MHMRPPPPSRAFTLVEVLIVVVILGILAAIAVPQFVGATEEAKISATLTDLHKLRRHLGVYRARNNDRLPEVIEGNGTWGQIIGREYLLSAPTNSWIGGNNRQRILFRSTPDAAFPNPPDYAWVFDTTSGEVWAAGFNVDDRPLPRP